MPREAAAGFGGGEKTAGKAGARRFTSQVPVRYRLGGKSAWRRGESENISSSEVLFRGEYLAETNDPVELRMRMPLVNSSGAAEVVCQGVILRVLPATGAQDNPALAVRILHFRLARP